MIIKKFNYPVSIQVYLGSGKKGERLRENLLKLAGPNDSVSEVIVGLLRKASPDLFKGVDNATNGPK